MMNRRQEEGKERMKKNKQKQRSGSRIPSIIGIIVCVILIPLLVMNLTIIIKSYLNPDKVPDFFGILPVVVLSGSMEPEILTGDLAILKRIDPSELKLNDIIAYKEGNTLVTHRIVELTENDGEPSFTTRGDANNASDRNPVAYSQVEGVYIYRIPGLGRLAMFMQTPLGILVFVGVPLCCFILYDIIRRRHANQKEKAKLDEAQAEIERLKAELTQKPDKTTEATIKPDKTENVKTIEKTDIFDLDMLGLNMLDLDMTGIDMTGVDMLGFDMLDISMIESDFSTVDDA